MNSTKMQRGEKDWISGVSGNMTFQEYQQQTATTAVYPEAQGITYCTLKLTSEAGEVADAIGKWIRNHEITDVNDLRRVKTREDVHTALGKIAGEIGDVLWYCSQLAAELDMDLEHIARANLLKLEQRKKDGELKERNQSIKLNHEATYGGYRNIGNWEEDLKLSTQQITRFCSICSKPILDHDTVITIQKGSTIDKQFHIDCWIKNKD